MYVSSLTKIFNRDGHVQARRHHDLVNWRWSSIIFLTRHNTVTRSQGFIGQDKSLNLSLSSLFCLDSTIVRINRVWLWKEKWQNSQKKYARGQIPEHFWGPWINDCKGFDLLQWEYCKMHTLNQISWCSIKLNLTMPSSKARQVRKRFFIQLTVVSPTNFISFYTCASRCPRKALCVQGNWFCASIMHKKGTHLFTSAFVFLFLVCCSRECREQEFVDKVCIKVSVKTKIAQTCSYRHRDSWLCILKNIYQILTLLAVGIAPLTRQLGLYLATNRPINIHTLPRTRLTLKGEAMSLLWTISSKTTFEESEECLVNFKQRLEAFGYPAMYRKVLIKG